jgi:hypothetical protein
MTEETTTTTTPESGTTTTPESATPSSWRDSLSADYKDKYTEFKNPEDFVKGYDNLVSKLGADPIVKPKSDAAPEEWQKYYNKLGRPESADKYAINLPENGLTYDDNMLNGFKKAAHESGLTQDQVEKVFGWYDASMLAADGAKYEAAEAELKTKWGGDYDKNLSAAADFAKQAVPADYQDVVAKYSNDPAFIQMLHGIKAKYATEDRVSGNGQQGNTEADRRSQAVALMNSEAWKNAFHPDHERTKLQVRDLYKN